MNLDVTACGGCLSNMAIAPDGSVMLCQSWLKENSDLGNVTTKK